MISQELQSVDIKIKLFCPLIFRKFLEQADKSAAETWELKLHGHSSCDNKQSVTYDIYVFCNPKHTARNS